MRLEDRACVACGDPLVIARPDNIPLCARCDEKARAKTQQIMDRKRAKRKTPEGQPFFVIRKVVLPE